MRITLCLLAILVVRMVGTSQTAHLTPHKMEIADEPDASTRVVVVEVDWRSTKLDLSADERVTANDQVLLEIKNFNFLRFGLTVKVSEEEVKVYKILDELWGSILPDQDDDRSAILTASDSVFASLFSEWRRGISSREGMMKGILKAVPASSALNAAQLASLTSAKQEVGKQAKEMDALREKVFSAIGLSRNIGEMQDAQVLYEAELKRHEALRIRMKQYVDAATSSVEGSLRIIGRKVAGNHVSIQLICHPLDSLSLDDQKAALVNGSRSVEYFVESKHLLTFFVGPTAAYIEDLTFEKVRSAAGNDLFQEVKSPTEDFGLVAFLGYQLRARSNGTGLIFASLGTDVLDPGKRVFAGLTVSLGGKAFLTAGGVTLEGEEGENADVSGADLFRRLKVTRKWGGFISFGWNPL